MIVGTIVATILAIWRNEAVRAIVKVILISFAAISMFVLVTLALTGWVFMILMMIHG